MKDDDAYILRVSEMTDEERDADVHELVGNLANPAPGQEAAMGSLRKVIRVFDNALEELTRGDGGDESEDANAALLTFLGYAVGVFNTYKQGFKDREIEGLSSAPQALQDTYHEALVGLFHSGKIFGENHALLLDYMERHGLMKKDTVQ